MNSDLQERPSAINIYSTINSWLNNIDISNGIKDWFEKTASSNDNEFKDLLKKIAGSNDNKFKDLLDKIDDDNEIKGWLEKIAYSNDNEIKDWCIKLASSNDFNEIKNLLEKIASNEIAKQFLDADKVIKSLPISKHSDEMYTSSIISTKLISKAIKAQTDSAQVNLDITEI
ncbi:hypothetical protein F8M41_004913 [Gigaspora margarita]|uniref:Uncharacterized protein n=1 Tax=Gigaspora margarita TaxID=4874 RepID=A0A8H3X9R4_GIGMA|nr:hypothetical protein F8M41_004913 [Gigaspora margarita]